MRTLFIGDLEAQYKLCRHELANNVIPDVDKIIQLGNIMSCSKSAKDKKELGRNEVSLAFWDKIEKEKIRLVGPNEIAALNFPNEWTNNTSNNFLRDGWLSETPTFLTSTVDNSRLVSHGGLTYGEWIDIGRPETAEEASLLLNEKYKNTLNQGPCYKTEGRPYLNANPIWADPILEFYPSWILAPESCPFDQIHGGESLNRERGRKSVYVKDNILSAIDKAYYRKFGSISEVKGAIFRGIDVDLPAKLIPSLPKDKAFYIEVSK